MTPLALTLPPSPLEMPTSYLSRLAARNLATDIGAFCQDVGLNFAAISTGDAAAIAHLCALAGLPALTFANRTVVKTSTMRYRLGAEVMNTETLSRGEIRFCSCCLTDALQVGYSVWEVIHELHWQFIHIRQCHKHGTRLQSYRTKWDPSSRFDFTAFIREQAQHISPRSETDAAADDLDQYLSARAYGAQSPSWCNGLEIPALIKACDAFGVLMDHGRDTRASSLPSEKRRDAMLTGFRILSAGPDGIRYALDCYNTRTPTRGGNQPHPSNGEVQRLLGSHAKQRQDLDLVREIVREYFLDHYPFRSGTVVLGQKIAQTRVFSLRGACREVGIRRSLLEEILIKHDVAERDVAGEFKLRAPLTRLLIERLRHEKLEYLDQNATADALGCSFAMFKQLQRDSILRPEEGDRHRMRKGYHRASLRLFLERLGAGTERVSAPGPHLCKLDLVTRKANCSVPVLVKLILDGKLRTSARLTDELRLDTLLVNPVDVMRALRLAEPNGFSRSEVKRRLFINAATLDFLIKRRMLEVRRQRHSITRVTRSYITGESMARFKDEFVTPGMFAQENSLSSQRAAKLLRDGKASPIEAKGGIRRIYARRDL